MHCQYIRVMPPDPKVTQFSKRLLRACDLKPAATALHPTTVSGTSSSAQFEDDDDDYDEEAEVDADLFEYYDDAFIEESNAIMDDFMDDFMDNFDEGADSDLARSLYP